MESYYVVLVGVYADSQARNKITNGGYSNSFFCCLWCVQQSLHVTRNMSDEVNEKGHKYPAGYVTPTPITQYALATQHVPLKPSEVQADGIPKVFCGETRARLTDQQQRERQLAAATSDLPEK